MFEIGKKVVYIMEEELTGISRNEIYTVNNIFMEYLFLSSQEENNKKIPLTIGPFHEEHFISLIDYRKEKLKKICTKLEIK